MRTGILTQADGSKIPGVLHSPPFAKWRYARDFIGGTPRSSGNADGTVPALSNTNPATNVDIHLMQFSLQSPAVFTDWGLVQNGGTALSIALGGTFECKAALYRMREDDSGDCGLQVGTAFATVTLGSGTITKWTGALSSVLEVDPGDYAWGVKFHPSLSGGQVCRLNNRWYEYTNSVPRKIPNVAYNAAFPTDLSGTTHNDWNSGGASTGAVAAFADWIAKLRQMP